MNKEYHIKLVDDLAALFGYRKRMKQEQDDMKNKGSRRINMTSYDIDKCLKACYEFIAQDKPDMAIIRIYEDRQVFIDQLNTFSENDILSDNPVQLEVKEMLREIIKAYKVQKATTTTAIASKLTGSWLFTDEELSNDELLDPRKYLFIENAIKEQLFKLYVYRKGKGRIFRTTQYKVYPFIGISHSLEEWLSFVKKQETESLVGDGAIVTMFLKLDYVSSEYSSFVITIHQKDSIWLASDQIDFDNPRCKRTSRRAERAKERHYESIALPYELVGQLDDIRSKNKAVLSSRDIETIQLDLSSVKAAAKRTADTDDDGYHTSFGYEAYRRTVEAAKEWLRTKRIVFSHEVVCAWGSFSSPKGVQFKHEGITKAIATVNDDDDKTATLIVYHRAEILQQPFKEIDAFDRMYFIGLVERFFEELEFQPPKERIMLASEFLNQKLLKGGTFNYDDNQLEHFDKSHKEVLKEIVSSVNMESQSLIKYDYSLVKQSPEFETNWLGTAAALDNLSKWTVLEEEAKKIKATLKKKLAPRLEKDTLALAKLLNDKIQRVVKIAFTEPTYELKSFGAWDNKSKASVRNFGVPIDKPKGRGYRSYRGLDLMYKDTGDYRVHPTCQFCNDGTKMKSHRALVHIRHYEQLVYLAGLSDRTDLPPYYQNYRAHDEIPYGGNSILNNVHPYTLIDDPCSQANPNGITIQLWMCGRCYQSFKKQYS